MPRISFVPLLRFVLCFVLLWSGVQAAASEADFRQLDSYVGRRPEFMAAKQHRIAQKRQALHQARTDADRLRGMDAMFREYYTFSFDSSMVYVSQGLQLARLTGNRHAEQQFLISRALLLATGGYYSQAESIMRSLPAEAVPADLRFDYYYAYAWLYNFWSAYCNDREFAPRYRQLHLHYLALLINQCPSGTPMQSYLMGELTYFRHPQSADCLRHYQRAYHSVPVNDRLSASSAYAIARTSRQLGRMDDYEHYLCKAGISDMVCPLKENLALQELSLYLYEKDERHADRAVSYIYASMEDAQFYNNRLRLLEISHILPGIVRTYQHQLDARRLTVRAALAVVSVLALVLVGLVVLGFRQNRKLNERREEVHAQNLLLKQLNDRLLETNRRRETYLRLFLDISALYIAKLDRMRKTVARCIKTGKTDDLLNKINRMRVTEEESAAFYLRFDQAFTYLYPDFVGDVNALFQSDHQFHPSSPHALTTELRILALMRLGVTGAQEIATLLFYSPQTIYNYRSAMKKWAVRPQSFDEDLALLLSADSRVTEAGERE